MRFTPSARFTSLALLLMASMSAAQAAPLTHAGRGIYHFTSQNGCPFATAADAQDCNRIVLDAPDVQASVDTEARVIVFSSSTKHPEKDVLGDVLLQGSGLDARGVRVPLRVRVLLRRDGKKWDPDIYAQAPVRGKFSDVQIDAYSIRVKEGDGDTGSEHEVLAPKKTQALLEQPSLAARVARNFVKVTPSNQQQPAGDDITIALGLGRLSKSVARARFVSSALPKADLEAALASGSWSIQLDALSSQIPLWVVQRELFTLGLEKSALLTGLRERGFKKNDRIELGAQNGQGYLRVNEEQEEFAGALASAQSFMRESFMGLILGWSRQASAAGTAPQTASTPGKPA